MDTSRYFTGVITFSCGNQIPLTTMTEQEFNDIKSRLEQRPCIRCQVIDGTLDLEGELAQLALNHIELNMMREQAYNVMLAAAAQVSQSRVN